MAVRAKGDGVGDRVFPSVSELYDVVDLEVGHSVRSSDKRCWTITSLTNALCAIQNFLDNV